MENREWKTGNGKPVNASVAICHSSFFIRGSRFSIFLLSMCVSFGASAATPASTPLAHVPEGFGKAKFGMTLEQVRQLYPTLVPAPFVTSAAFFKSPHLTRYWMTNVDVPGLKPKSSVEFRFWKNQLWSIIVYYGGKTYADVVEHLQQSYGPPTVKNSQPSWTLGKVTIITSPGQMWYSLDDGDISNDVRREFMEAIQQRQQAKPAQPPALATATPPTSAGASRAGQPPERTAPATPAP